MPIRKPITAISIGAVLLFFGVAQANQYRFKPPVNLGPSVNSVGDERDPYISADGLKLFFASAKEGGAGDMDIWMSSWSGTTWGTPVNCGLNVNSALAEWSPSTSPDGKRLYFIAFGRQGSQGGWDAWYSDWDSILQQWGPAQNMEPPINTFATDWCPEISRDGQTFYYASNGLGHPNGQAIAYSHWNGSSWGSPQFFPVHINDTGTEERPSLTTDEDTMYFVRWIINYGPSIWVTRKDSVGNWSQPSMLDTNVNHPSGATTDPSITPDGSKLFFSSARNGGQGPPTTTDIWVTERVLMGDLNIDGAVTASDVVLELNRVFLGEPYSAEDIAGEVNCDGLFTSSDVVLILNRAYLGALFPCA